MSKEPTLTFVLSRPTKFHCSFCRDHGDEGSFTLATSVEDLVTAFKKHVEKYHSDGKDFNEVKT